MESDLAEIGWIRFNLTWCTGYPPSRYRKGLDFLIHRYPSDFWPQSLHPILLFYIEANLHNNHLGRKSTHLEESTGTLAPEQYGSRKAKEADAQDLNTRLLYDPTRLKRVSATSVFSDLVSNYNLVAHNIAALSLQHANVPKEPIICKFTTIQDMVHSVRITFGDSDTFYGGDKRDPPSNRPYRA